MTTIRNLLDGRPTLVQLDILQVADRLFPMNCGRYYMGPLSDEDLKLFFTHVRGLDDQV